jgi:hypothetical protein
VKVHVVDLLASLRATVDTDPKATLSVSSSLRDRAGGQQAPADVERIRGLHRLNALDVALGNDEYVKGRFRIDVFEGEHDIIFVLDLGRALSRHDATEETVIHAALPRDAVFESCYNTCS